MSDEQTFLNIIAEYDDFADDVDLSLSPEELGVGEYNVLFTGFTTGSVTKNDVENATARATFQVVAGDSEGESFTDLFWFNPQPEGVGFAQRRFLILARCISGRTIRTLAEATTVIKEAVGSAVLLISIDSSVSKKNSNTYYNVSYKGTIDSPEA